VDDVLKSESDTSGMEVVEVFSHPGLDLAALKKCCVSMVTQMLSHKPDIKGRLMWKL